MTATATKRKASRKLRHATGEEVLLIERPLTNEKGILALASDLRQALIDQGIGLNAKPMVVKITLQAKPTGSKEATKEPSFDPRAAGLELVEKLKAAEGGALTGSELKEHGLTSATLHGRRKARRIVYWRDARHDFFYPRWQFTEAGALRPGIEKILKVFNSADEWRIIRYFLSPRRQLDGKKPLDLLRAGEVEKVISHAQNNFAEGSW